MTALPVDRTVADLRTRLADWRNEGARVALVPTMGALHAGHLALVEEARKHGRVAVTLFVNPKQFGPKEDFTTYPRDEAADLDKLRGAGAEVVFAPATEELYPAGFATTITVAGPALELEAITRPHFFAGVATVVAKLLIAAVPDVAVFGEKDYQQLLVIRRLTEDLGLPIQIVGHPTLREPDGLALSSRNAYLSPDERAIAPLLFRSLTVAAANVRSGMAIDAAVAEATEALVRAGFRVDYVAVRDAATLAPASGAPGEALRILGAAWLGRTRLIDNLAV